ncbi:hypothetical protein J3F84DRAFT_384786 [Trichoderma pleuroticola]
MRPVSVAVLCRRISATVCILAILVRGLYSHTPGWLQLHHGIRGQNPTVSSANSHESKDRPCHTPARSRPHPDPDV